jgi:hypothetical protein
MTIPPEVWLTIGYVAGGLLIAVTSLLIGPWIGRFLAGAIAEVTGL